MADFSKGDRVRHIGRNEAGTVTDVTNSVVQVTFDNLTPRGHKSVGEFDEVWFRAHPGWLVREPAAESPSCHGSEG